MKKHYLTPRGVLLFIHTLVEDGWMPFEKLPRAYQLVEQCTTWGSSEFIELVRESQQAAQNMYAAAGGRLAVTRNRVCPVGPLKEQNAKALADWRSALQAELADLNV